MRAADVRKLILVLTVAAAAVMAGCGDSGSTGNSTIDQRIAVDNAFETIIAAQNEAATSYSAAIQKTTGDADVKSFAAAVLKERQREAQLLERFKKSGDDTPSISEAAKTLGIPLDKLAITADGKPLAAPSTDNAYLLAMKANTYGALRSSAAEIEKGGPGTSQLANVVQQSRNQELVQINELRSQK